MAKRKRKPGHGSKLRSVKNYQDDQYTPYIFKAEVGILQAWAIDPDLRDGDVRQVLRGLIKKSGKVAEVLTTDDEASRESVTTLLGNGKYAITQWLIITNLRSAFEEHGPLNTEDVTGILRVINNSVGAWNRGMRGQEYLKYIQDFLGNMGAGVRRLSENEIEMLGLDQIDNTDNALEDNT